jgi:hypothetical protein
MLPQAHRFTPSAAWFPPLPRRRLSRSAHWSPATKAALAALVAALAAACSSGAATGSGGQAVRGAAASGDTRNLRGVCPATIVVQSSWFPEVEHGAEYQLLGKGYGIDSKGKSVTGRLVAAGVDTGVKIQIRAGGPAIGFQQTSAQMYADPSITLGMLNTDEMIQQSKDKPVLGVVAPLDIDPQVIMWDPASHPEWNTISDIGQANSKVLYYQGSPFMGYLLGAGILLGSSARRRWTEATTAPRPVSSPTVAATPCRDTPRTNPGRGNMRFRSGARGSPTS